MLDNILSPDIVILDVYVIAIFFIAMLYISYRYGRNIKTVAEYALADRNLPLPVLTMTFMATSVGASVFLGTTANIFDNGIIEVLFFIRMFSTILPFGHTLGYRYFDTRFDKHITISDMFKYFLGNKIEKLISIIFSIDMIIVFALQLTAVGMVGEYLFGHSYEIIAVSAAIIILVYTSLGGMRAVAITDVIQFGFIVLIIPYMANHAINAAGGMDNIFTDKALKLENLEDNTQLSSYIFHIF